MDAHATWKGGYEVRLENGRGHTVTVDEPVEDGGSNLGPASIELLVMSLSGCISTIFHIVAEKRKLAFDGFEVSLNAERSEKAPTIERVRGHIEVRTSAPQSDVDTVLRLTLKTCPVGVLFERANVPVEVTATVLPPYSVGSNPAPYKVPEPEWVL